MKLRLAPAALVLAILSLGAAFHARFGSHADRPIEAAELVRILDRRPFEARLTGDFAYAPCVPARRPRDLPAGLQCPGSPRPGTRRWQEVADLAARERAVAEKTHSPEALWRNAVSTLTLSEDEKTVHRALSILEKAVEQSPRNARMLSDLSVGYLLRAQLRDDPDDLLLAISAADRALKVDPALPEARFNLAVVLEKLHAETAARSAWLDFLRLDGRSGWAEEAGDRLQALMVPAGQRVWEDQIPILEQAVRSSDLGTVEAVVRAHPQAAREYAELQLLGTWAEAQARGDKGGAAQVLDVARALGKALARVNGERMASEAVATIDRALHLHDATLLQALVTGHRAFKEGYAFYDALETGRAAERLEEARQALEAAGSPFAARAAFYLVCCDFNRERYAEALAGVQRLERILAGQPYSALLAHIAWVDGVTQLIRGYPAGSLKPFERASALFARLGEGDNVAAIHALQALSLEYLGRARESWAQCYLGLREADKVRNPRHRYMIALQASDFLFRQGRPAIALYVQAEVVRHARDSNAFQLANAHAMRGLLYSQLGDSQRAASELGKAQRCTARTPDAAARRRSLADVSLIQGRLLAETQPARAIGFLSSAIRVYEDVQQHLQALAAYRTRAHAYGLLHDVKQEEEDLRRGIRAYDHLGQGISEEQTRLSFFELTSKVFDEMILFQMRERRRGDLAFMYADRAKTRILPALAAGLRVERAVRQNLISKEPEPLSTAQAQASLPAGTSLIEYSVLDDRLVIWLLRRDRLEVFEEKVSQEEIRRLVEEMRYSPRAPRQGAGKEPAELLYERIVRPWRSRVTREELLVFVPDKELGAVPFAALQDPVTGRFLIEDNPITISPSATFYIATLHRDRILQSPRGPMRALFVGDPAFDRNLFRWLPVLPNAAQEAAGLQDLYGTGPGSVLLTGAQADKQSFVELAPQFPLIHFAGHAVLNSDHPLLSLLVLAPAPAGADPGLLHAWEIYRMDLHRTRLVVLSSCGAGNGSPVDGAGVTTLARAFLAAGAPAVIASLAPVKDHTTAELFRRFHLGFQSHHDPARALRDAQRALLASPDPEDRQPAAWGAFQVFGASSHQTAEEE